MVTLVFKNNPLITALELLGINTENETYNPTTVYFDDLKKTKYIKGNSIYYYFKPNNRYVTENHLKGVLVYQNKDLDITLVYRVNQDGLTQLKCSFNEKIHLENFKIDRFEYIFSNRNNNQDSLIFRLDEDHIVDFLINFPLPQCV